MKTILVTGGNGQLGSSLKRIAKEYTEDYQLEFTDYHDLDITSQDDISNYLDTKPFFAIINCAAYTAVDKAETDIENANLVNRKAVKKLALLQMQLETLLIIHFYFVFLEKYFLQQLSIHHL